MRHCADHVCARRMLQNISPPKLFNRTSKKAVRETFRATKKYFLAGLTPTIMPLMRREGCREIAPPAPLPSSPAQQQQEHRMEEGMLVCSVRQKEKGAYRGGCSLRGCRPSFLHFSPSPPPPSPLPNHRQEKLRPALRAACI